jgi:recombination protein RecA
MAKIIMQEAKFERVPLGLYTVDKALGLKEDDGIPIPSLAEIYGDEHTGKTTFVLYACSQVAGDEQEIVFCDVEGTMTKDYAANVVDNAGFNGTLRFIDSAEKVKGVMVHRPHEDMLQESMDRLMEEQVKCGLLDSIGLFQTATAHAKDLGERDVGQKPKTFNDASRRLAWILRETAIAQQEAKLYWYINHAHPNIGGPGFYTPGGLTKDKVANVRLWIRRRESDVPDGSGNFVSLLRVQKLKQGGKSSAREGYVFFIPDYGVSREMTAVIDCVALGLANRTSANVLLGDQKMGRIGTLAGKAEKGDHDVFQEFYNALKEYDNAEI